VLELAFSTEPILGWRVWRVMRPVDRARGAHEMVAELLDAERGGQQERVEALFRHRLRSLTEQTFWPGRRRLDARCRGGPVLHDAAPHADCTCGVWALRSRAAAVELATDYAYAAGLMALGQVALWGRIVEQERGWRGQYAYPQDLTVFGATDAVADELRRAYGITVACAPRVLGRRAA
jgi:hypothetical protein